MTLLDGIAWCWAIFFIFWLVTAFSAKPAVERQNRAGRLGYLSLLVLGFGLLSRGSSRPASPLGFLILPPSSAVLITGFVLTVLGLVLALWARITLGTNWSGTVTFKKDHELIRRGPYAFVRHPIYTAVLLMFLGTAIARGNVGGFAGLTFVFASIWIKLKQEEALLLRHFPNEYASYCSRVKRLVPFLL